MYLPQLLAFLQMSINAVYHAYFTNLYFVVRNWPQSNCVCVFRNQMAE